MSEAPAISSLRKASALEGSRIPVELAVRVQASRSTPTQGFTLDVNFRVAPGFTILFGGSGAGKTMLLDCVAGLIEAGSGRISVGELVLFDRADGVNIPVPKRGVGYVFQSLAVFPHLTVEQNVAFGLAKCPRSERSERVSNILREFRISALAKRRAREISGGESQRVALARTLVTEPQVLLLDEPLAALDAATKGKIIDDLRGWNQIHGIPILYVTHSREEVFALGEQVIVLDRGRIVAQGTPHEVMTAPSQETVAQLAGFENVFDVVVEEVHPERGTMSCRIVVPSLPVKGNQAALRLETPLVRAGVGSELRVGIRAGDILLATSPPQGLSARNVFPGLVTSLEQRDVIVIAKVMCAVSVDVHLTLAARDALELQSGREVWLVIKTHSCRLMQKG
jgi:molybdate transport system ATP-binding protein